MNFFKKIEEIGHGLARRKAVFCAQDLSGLARKYSTQSAQLLLDKVGDLIYLHKIFQHISVGVVRERRPGRKPASREFTWAECLESINNTVTGVENWLIISPPKKGIVRISCNGFAIAPTRAR
ncbi:MAG TPA: hypothetical protein VJC18_02105 [bacterium]|nr:hypothetical protein [bacterium]